MTLRYQRAARIRAALLQSLGGCCTICGATGGLEMHLLKSDGGKHHAMNGCDRVYFYAKQSALGNVQLLCGHHHRSRTVAENHARRNQRLFTSCEDLLPAAPDETRSAAAVARSFK